MPWTLLILAGLLEIGWAIGLKYTEGFTRPLPTVLTVAAMVASLWLLGLAVRTLPVGTAYAVWVGVGAVGTAILGIVLLGESANLWRVLSLVLIVVGIIGLKLATPG
jgi:quaternary ammonium compound-resistance protein SugE